MATTYNASTILKMFNRTGGKISDCASTVRVIKNILDFGEYRNVYGVACPATSDIAAIKIDGGMIVLAVGAKVLKAEGATCTASVGDTSDDVMYLSATTDFNSVSTNVGVTTPKYYSADDYIRVKIANAASNAKVEVWAVVADAL